MSLAAERPRSALLDQIGVARSLDAYVVGLAFLQSGVLAAALGDGRVAFLGAEGTDVPLFVTVHAGACLSLAVDLGGRSLLTGGDDGRLANTDITGRVTEVAAVPGQWVDPIAVSAASGLRAAAMGKTAYLVAREGEQIATFDHPHTVGGLAFDPRGRRLAAAHYGGVSLWWARSGKQEARRLSWRGSHLGLTWSPDGKYIVTAMQENELHGWRILDGADMRMSGYPVKVKSTAWLHRGRRLATSGAELAICWPFHGKGGPMGKAPLELGRVFGGPVTVVSAHPHDDMIAAGYEDGAAVLVHIDGGHTILLKQRGEGSITALAWSTDGRHLAIGTDSGLVGCVPLSDGRRSRL